jgi:hypothetical protein
MSPARRCVSVVSQLVFICAHLSSDSEIVRWVRRILVMSAFEIEESEDEPVVT